jgi:hypothetical protein
MINGAFIYFQTVIFGRLENVNGTDHSEDPVVDGKIILEWILNK